MSRKFVEGWGYTAAVGLMLGVGWNMYRVTLSRMMINNRNLTLSDAELGLLEEKKSIKKEGVDVIVSVYQQHLDPAKKTIAIQGNGSLAILTAYIMSFSGKFNTLLLCDKEDISENSNGSIPVVDSKDQLAPSGSLSL